MVTNTVMMNVALDAVMAIQTPNAWPMLLQDDNSIGMGLPAQRFNRSHAKQMTSYQLCDPFQNKLSLVSLIETSSRASLRK